MIELTVKNVKWLKRAAVGTKKEFDEGKQEFLFEPVILCELPNNFDVFNKGNQPYVYFIQEKRPVQLYMTGYNVGANEIEFSPMVSYKSEFEIKAYSL